MDLARQLIFTEKSPMLPRAPETLEDLDIAGPQGIRSYPDRGRTCPSKEERS